MDGDGGLNMRNWGYYESPSLKSHLGLQLMPSMADREPLLGAGRDSTVLANVNNGGGGPFHHQRDCGIPASLYQMDYTRDAWIHHRDNKFFSMLPSNSSGYAVMPETTAAAVATTTQHHHPHPHHPPVHMLRQPETSNDERLMVRTDGLVGDNSINGPSKKRGTGKGAEKGPKTKRPRKAPNAAKDGSSGSTQRSKAAKKTTEVVINGIDMDISSIPIPVCSCTGTPQQCYRWGSGGWQSACCTTVMSMYPLPMSSKRRGARIAGRKMSLGAFKKVLEKLAAEGYNFANPIDLRTHWAKHGTNKFVTIR